MISCRLSPVHSTIIATTFHCITNGRRQLCAAVINSSTCTVAANMLFDIGQPTRVQKISYFALSDCNKRMSSHISAKLLAAFAELLGTELSLRPLLLFQTLLQLTNNLFRSYWGMDGETQQLHKTHFFRKLD